MKNCIVGMMLTCPIGFSTHNSCTSYSSLNIASIGVAIPGQAKHVLNSIHLMRSCGTFENVEATPDSNDNRLTEMTMF